LMMGTLSRVNNSHVIGQELKRKALHISVGLTALSFPLFLSEKWMIIASIGLVVAWLLAVRRVAFLRHHFGSVLHDVRRTSLGDVYFAFAIGGLLLLTQGNSDINTDVGRCNCCDCRQDVSSWAVGRSCQGQNGGRLCCFFCRRFRRQLLAAFGDYRSANGTRAVCLSQPAWLPPHAWQKSSVVVVSTT